MDKATFLAILHKIVSGFEDPQFRARFVAARAEGDVGQLMALPAQIQETAFAAHDLDPVAGVAAFKAAGRQFALEPEAVPLLARMKAALDSK